MKVYVNGEERQLHVIDRSTGRDYAKQVVCGQELLHADAYGYFCLSEEEYDDWQHILAMLQDSEDIRFSLRNTVDRQELDDYIYEETKYLTGTKDIADMEHVCLREVYDAWSKKDAAWLRENNFTKTAKKNCK